MVSEEARVAAGLSLQTRRAVLEQMASHIAKRHGQKNVCFWMNLPKRQAITAPTPAGF